MKVLVDASLEVLKGGGGWGVILSTMHDRSRMTDDHRPSHPYQGRDGVRRVFTDQADIRVSNQFNQFRVSRSVC